MSSSLHIITPGPPLEPPTPGAAATGPRALGSADTPPSQSARAPRPRRRAQIDPTSLIIESNIEIPKRPTQRNPSKWLPLFQQMQLNDSIYVPDTTPAKMGYVRRLARSIGLCVLVRREAQGVRLFRVDPHGVHAADDGL